MKGIALAVRPDLPHIVTSLPGPRAEQIMARDREFVSASYTRFYPLVAERGEGAIVEDVDGNRFLDFNAGIGVVATGHCHPRVVAAICEQAERLIHMSGTDFYYENMVELAEKLSQIAPGGVPRRVHFGNSGAEAIEAAIKVARYHTGRDKFIAFLGAFHGRTGRMWASEHFDLVPDVMAVAAALTTIELLEEGLVSHAARMGSYTMEHIGGWPRRFACVGDVRGLGLMIGIEFVKDKATREKAPELRDRVVQMAFERGLLVLGAGENTIRLSPPLTLTRDQADFAMDTLEDCIQLAVP